MTPATDIRRRAIKLIEQLSEERLTAVVQLLEFLSELVMAFMQAYKLLQEAVELLYAQAQSCIDYDNYINASLLEAKADKLFEQADSILFILSEQNNE